MEYRTLGNTGLSVSALGYGASPLGSVFRKIDEAEGIRTVHTALDLGINFIDVSPYYGITLAETVLGKALREIPRDSYYLATKVGRYEDSGFDFSASRVTASVDESLSRLNVEYVDIIQCHDIEFGSLDQIISETLPALEKIRDQGKARLIGITGLPLKIFSYILDRTSVDTILSYCHYSLNDTSLDSIVPYIEKKQVGIISASPLSMGLLTDRSAPDWHPAPKDIQEACERAARHCRDQDANIAQIALQFSLSNPDIATTLVGTANPENIKSNVSCLEQPLNETILKEIQGILSSVRNKTWPSGRAENN